MKTAINIMLSIVLACPMGFAADPMDAARQAVDASMETARNKARAAIVEDFNFALTDVLSELYESTDLTEVRQRIFTEQKDLQEAFQRIANLDENEIAQLKETYLQVFEEYKSYVRQRFDASFIAPEARYNFKESVRLASRALRAFESRCDSGRGAGGSGIPAFMYPDAPKPKYSISMGFGPNGGYGDTSYNGTGSQAEKNRNTIANASLGTASMITSIAWSGSSGATVALCQAAMPWALAGGAVLALGMMYLNHMERVKMENKIVQAKVYAFHETASDEDIARFYREGCSVYRQKVAVIRQVLDAALSGVYDLEKLASRSEAFDADLGEFQKLIESHDHLKAEIEQMITERDESQDNARREELTKALDKKLSELKKLGSKLAEEASPEKIADMMLRFLIAKQADLETQLSNVSWTIVDKMQRQAFQKIQRIVQLIQRRSFAKYLKGDDELSQDLRSLDEFLAVKNQFRETLTLHIKEIFGRVDSAQVRNAEKMLGTTTRSLIQKYAHNSEVMNFARQVRALIGDF